MGWGSLADISIEGGRGICDEGTGVPGVEAAAVAAASSAAENAAALLSFSLLKQCGKSARRRAKEQEWLEGLFSNFDNCASAYASCCNEYET